MSIFGPINGKLWKFGPMTEKEINTKDVILALHSELSERVFSSLSIMGARETKRMRGV